ncbi:MAG: trypsin-like peptidase domain-containing protein, partial [Anaerolineales bacterium]|nr:trypsin-like peptidase domain-containing protein [Anaerolineales bacterium]
MKTFKQFSLSLLLIFVMLGLAACGAETAVTSPTLLTSSTTNSNLTAIIATTPVVETAVSTTETNIDIDTEAIAATVLAEVNAQLAQQTSSPVVSSNNSVMALASDTLQSALINVYQQTNPSVVYIIVPQIGSGSGFVYSDDGYIVTNNHVVEDGRSYEVVFANGERMAATLIGADIDSDLAVLKVDELPT